MSRMNDFGTYFAWHFYLLRSELPERTEREREKEKERDKRGERKIYRERQKERDERGERKIYGEREREEKRKKVKERERKGTDFQQVDIKSYLKKQCLEQSVLQQNERFW